MVSISKPQMNPMTQQVGCVSVPTLGSVLGDITSTLAEARDLATIVHEDLSGTSDPVAEKLREPTPSGLVGDAVRAHVIACDLVRLIRNAGIALGCQRMSVAAPADGRLLNPTR